MIAAAAAATQNQYPSFGASVVRRGLLSASRDVFQECCFLTATACALCSMPAVLMSVECHFWEVDIPLEGGNTFVENGAEGRGEYAAGFFPYLRHTHFPSSQALG